MPDNRPGPEPSFRGGHFRVLFFSRGRGRGHVIPDLSLVQELYKLDNGIDVGWASYGTGALTLAERGYPLWDLQLPDENPFLETLLRATRIIARAKPHLVIAHEEFPAATAAKLLGLPILFITDYFLPTNHMWMQSMAYSDEILFIDEPGHFEEPASIRGKVHYTGPFVRPLSYTLRDRERARRELDIDPKATCLLVLPGNWFTEERAPIFDLVSAAYKALPLPRRQLVWIAGQDCSLLTARARRDPTIVIKDSDWQLDRWMVACDIAITKATRKTSLELASLGVPSISLSHGLNPIDDVRVSRIPTNLHLNARTTNGEQLAGQMSRMLREPPSSASVQSFTGLSSCAHRIRTHITRIREKQDLRMTA